METEVKNNKELTTFLLEQAGIASSVEKFVKEALPWLVKLTGSHGLAVVESIPPEWNVLGSAIATH